MPAANGLPTEPLWLWVGDDGRPLAPSTWQSAFRRANERCARLTSPSRSTPTLCLGYLTARSRTRAGCT
jgi:hypothetical protein